MMVLAALTVVEVVEEAMEREKVIYIKRFVVFVLFRELLESCSIHISRLIDSSSFNTFGAAI